MQAEHTHMLTESELEKIYSTNIQTGLQTDVSVERLQKFGKNAIAEEKKQSELLKFLKQFCEPTTIILILAGVISVFLTEYTNAIVIGTLLLVNSIIGFVQEHRAETSLKAIQQMTSPKATVIRDGIQQKIASSQIVPGDIVLLETGDYVPADLRLIEVSELRIDESALTGESLPVEKNSNTIQEKQVPLAECVNKAFMGTLVTHGRGKCIVISTGKDTEFGRIAQMLGDIGQEKTPLQKKLSEISKVLSIISTVVCLCIFAIGLLQGQALYDIAMSAFSLAIAAIPEGMPLIVSMILALGIGDMAKNNAIMKNLNAIETAGAANIVLSDKTGTLTQNKMTVTALYTNHQVFESNHIDTNNNALMELLRFGLLNNNAISQLNDNCDCTILGEATEAAILQTAVNAGLNQKEMSVRFPRIEEIPFNSDRKCMTTIHETNDGKLVIVKGAIEAVLSNCSSLLENGDVYPLSEEKKMKILEQSNGFSESALRVISVGYKNIQQTSEDKPDYEKDLIFCGLFAMMDPPKAHVKATITEFKAAGIETAMITGDNKLTATAIAKMLGISKNTSQTITGSELDTLSPLELEQTIQNYRVFARVTPNHKLKLVEAFQKNGNVAIMTGDGVNDAPALKKADIGVSMGIGGTEVAKGAADMILADDNFSTISYAILYGRQAYANIKKSIHLMLCGNIGEIVAILLATALGKFLFGVPILLLSAVQILWFNVVSDTLLCVALGMEPVNQEIMMQKPRKKTESFFGNGLGTAIGFHGIMLGLLTFSAYIIGVSINGNNQAAFQTANTMAFMTLSFGQFIHAFSLKSSTQSAFYRIFSNKPLIFVFLFNSFLQVLLVFVPVLRDKLFHMSQLSMTEWIVVLSLSVVPLVVMEIQKKFFTKS